MICQIPHLPRVGHEIDKCIISMDLATRPHNVTQLSSLKAFNKNFTPIKYSYNTLDINGNELETEIGQNCIKLLRVSLYKDHLYKRQLHYTYYVQYTCYVYIRSTLAISCNTPHYVYCIVLY